MSMLGRGRLPACVAIFAVAALAGCLAPDANEVDNGCLNAAATKVPEVAPDMDYLQRIGPGPGGGYLYVPESGGPVRVEWDLANVSQVEFYVLYTVTAGDMVDVVLVAPDGDTSAPMGVGKRARPWLPYDFNPDGFAGFYVAKPCEGRWTMEVHGLAPDVGFLPIATATFLTDPGAPAFEG